MKTFQTFLEEKIDTNWISLTPGNKKDMKPFHIDYELERPILFKNVLSC